VNHSMRLPKRISQIRPPSMGQLPGIGVLDRRATEVHNVQQVCAHRVRRTVDVGAIISGLEELDREDLARVEAALRRRLQCLVHIQATSCGRDRCSS
jgi:hypothetical protein